MNATATAVRLAWETYGWEYADGTVVYNGFRYATRDEAYAASLNYAGAW